MDEITNHADVVEIVELDDRLDTAFDPITLWPAVPADTQIICPQSQCGSSVAGCSKPTN
jgi:hypothetical protein